MSDKGSVVMHKPSQTICNLALTVKMYRGQSAHGSRVCGTISVKPGSDKVNWQRNSGLGHFLSESYL